MAKPQIIIRSQVRIDKIIRITGVITGNPDTVTADLPAASVPNGAVTRPQGTVTLNSIGEFSYEFTACPYGNYAPATITATNQDGTATATSWPMTLFVPKTAPVGTPRVLLPPFVAPRFTASKVPMGGVVTTITLESTSSTNQTNLPFTIGQPFKDGDLAPSDFLVGRIAGQPDIPLQFNVKATHPNGSVRHAIISGVLPSLANGASQSMQFVRASSGASTVAAPSTAIAAGGFAVNMTITSGGVSYTADATAAMAAGMSQSGAWIGGDIATEYIVNLPFKTESGAEHPDLVAQFCVRHYPGAGKAKVDVSIEHAKAFTAIYDVAYSGAANVGSTKLTIAAFDGGDLVHFPGARWKRTLWWNNSSPVHVKHNISYLLDSRQVSNYDRSITIDEATLADLGNRLSGAAFHMMGNGLFAKSFGGQGGRPELGLASAWYVIYVLSQDKRAKRMMEALAECAGSWNVHRRDTSTGPAAGMPIDVVHYPRATRVGTSGDSANSATGQFERFPTRVTSSTLNEDASHQSEFGYIPYVVTGDFFYFEELAFWNSFNQTFMNPGSAYRDSEKALFKSDQVRGQAWMMRTLAHTAAITPDSHPSKNRLQYWLQNNLSWYNEQYTDNPNANKLGIITNGSAAVGYSVNGVTGNGVGNFQLDFITQSMGMIAELGYKDAHRLALWTAKWQVERMIGQGACFTHATYYYFMVRDTSTSPFFTSIAEVYQKTLPAELNALSCFSQERLEYMNATRALPSNAYLLGDMVGYPYSTEGFPANLQPALAYAVDIGYPDADLAWQLFDERPTKPDYAKAPQFAVVPRGFVAPEEPTDPTPDPDPTPTPPSTDPENMAIADSVKDYTTTTGIGSVALAGTPDKNYRPWLTPPITVGARVPYSIKHTTLNEFENGWGILVSEFELARIKVTSSSNGDQAVNFSEGIKTVECTLTVAMVEELAGAHNVSVASVSEGETIEFLMMVGELPKRLAAPAFGMSFQQMTLLPGGIVLDTDEIQVNRGGIDYRAPRSYFGSTVPVDNTAPTLSAASASSTGANTATGSITTGEGNGTLYCLASTASTATATAVKGSAFSQAVSSTGAKNFSITGLTAATTYYLHFLHRDAAGNDSAVLSSASFTTAAATDTTAPTLSSPTATQTGSTTASGSVSTNEANGQLYRMVSANATETAATVKAANLITNVTATGAQAVSFSGLAAGTQYYAHYLHRDAAGNDSTVANSGAFTTAAAADTTAPTLSSPTATLTGATSATGTVSTNEANGILYCLFSTITTSTAAQVKASTMSKTVSSSGVQSFDATGLTPGVTYYAHFVHVDASGNESAKATSSGIAVPAAGDTTAPTLSSATGTQTGATTASGSVSTNEGNGTLYRYVSTNAAETAATVIAANLTSAVSAPGTQNVSFTGLIGNTQYYAYFLHRDAAGNDSTLLRSAAFTTAAVAYNVTGYSSNAIVSTLDASSGASFTYNPTPGKAFTGTKTTTIGNHYWFIKAASDNTTVPASAHAGWSKSSTVPPSILWTGATPSPNPNSTSTASVNGASPMGYNAANKNFTSGNMLWVPQGDTGPWYFWIKPVDGNWICVNPSGMTVTGA